jgi:hypothetical protein
MRAYTQETIQARRILRHFRLEHIRLIKKKNDSSAGKPALSSSQVALGRKCLPLLRPADFFRRLLKITEEDSSTQAQRSQDSKEEITEILFLFGIPGL